MLMRADAGVLVIVDIQSRLAAAVEDAAAVIGRTRILLDAARELNVPVLVSEQYPQGLGGTDPRLGALPVTATVVPKLTFSCCRDAGFQGQLERLRRAQIVLCGMETHVCVLQTALDLRERGYDVFAVEDAVGSRRQSSKQLGLARMRDRGIDVVDSEMVVFEWAERAGTDQFRALSRLVK